MADTAPTFTAPPFPTLILDDDAGFWRGPLALGGTTPEVTLYVDASLSEASYASAKELLAELTSLQQRAREGIIDAAGKESEGVDGFFAFFRDELPEALPEALRGEAPAEALTSALMLCGVALHSDHEGSFDLTLDFTFGREHSDELLAVRFSPTGELCDVSHES